MNISSKFAILLSLSVISTLVSAKVHTLSKALTTPNNSQQLNEGNQPINKINQAGGVLKSFPPFYPSKAQLDGVEGYVDVVINVNTNGEAASITITNAKPKRHFEKNTIRSIEKWRFHKKMINGTVVPYQLTQRIEFKLKNFTMGEIAHTVQQ